LVIVRGADDGNVVEWGGTGGHLGHGRGYDGLLGCGGLGVGAFVTHGFEMLLVCVESVNRGGRELLGFRRILCHGRGKLLGG
jgi:hypothetical protein